MKEEMDYVATARALKKEISAKKAELAKITWAEAKRRLPNLWARVASYYEAPARPWDPAWYELGRELEEYIDDWDYQVEIHLKNPNRDWTDGRTKGWRDPEELPGDAAIEAVISNHLLKTLGRCSSK